MVHTYIQNDYKIAVDGNSGSIHLLTDLAYEIIKDTQSMPSIEDTILKLKDTFAESEIREAYDEVKELYDQGVLYTTSEELEKAVNLDRISKSVKALCLHISHDCNLRCKYCFASEGDYKSGRELMSKDIAFKAVDFLVNNSVGRPHIEIDFFGGEPLMNFNVVKETVEYARQLEKETGKHFYFTTTTNGTLLNDENIKYINENMDNVVISVDGRKEIHDAVRFDVAGHGSYDRVIPKAQKLVSERNGKSYFIRGTFTSKNLDFSKDVMHLADLGFKEISVEPVVGSGSDIYFNENDVPTILAEYENLAKQYIERLSKGDGFRFYHFNINTYDGPCLYKKIAACGAGYEYLAVSPDGNIYPCHQFVGHKEYVIGNVYEGITNKKISEDFRNNNIFAKEKCKDCWAKLFCSGGCHADAFFTNGKIDEPNEQNCTFQKKRLECAIMIQAWKAEQGEN